MEKIYEDINDVMSGKAVIDEEIVALRENDIPLTDFGKQDQKRAKKIHTMMTSAVSKKVYGADYFFDGMKNCVMEYETGPSASIQLDSRKLKLLSDEVSDFKIFPSTVFVKWKAIDTVKK